MQNVSHSMIKDKIQKKFCPYCEDITDIELISKKECLPVLGERVNYEALVYKCIVCGNEFATTELEERNFKIAYDIYRKRHNLLTPEEIKRIREKYGLSQRNFSRFLGLGEITIHRYEAGSIQDKAHNEILVLVADPRNALKILELNRDKLSPRIADKLEKRIKELIKQAETNCYISISNFISLNVDDKNTPPTINSGYKYFDPEKLENLILYILEKLNGIGRTRLNKLLWYCDFKHFKEHIVSITGARYIHLPFGPVPDDYELTLLNLQMKGKIESEELIYNEHQWECFKAVASADISKFNSKEIETVNYVLEKLGKLSANQIKELSHEETAYKKTILLEVISYDYALELSI